MPKRIQRKRENAQYTSNRAMIVLVILAYLENSSFKYGSKEGPAHGKCKADESKQKRKENQDVPTALIVGKDVCFHGNDAIDINFGVDKLQQQPGQKTASGMIFFNDGSAFEGFPGQIEHVRSSHDQHRQFNLWNDARKRIAKKGTDQHDQGKTGPDPQIKGK